MSLLFYMVVRIIITKKISLKEPTVLEGFSGIGFVGPLAAQYIVEQLNMEQVGYIESDMLPPMAILSKGVVMHPLRVFASKKYNLVVFESEFPLPKKLISEIAKEIVDWSKKNKIKILICLEGIGVPQVPTKQKVYAIATNKNLQKNLEKDIKLLKSGLMIGVSAAILLECKSKKVPSICLMTESRPSFPDGRAAAALIDKLNKILNININPNKLIKESDEFEQKLKKLLEKARITKAKPTVSEKTIYG